MAAQADWQGAAATSWVDEFLDFASAKRNVHWREKSDEEEDCEGGGRSGSKRGAPVHDDDRHRYRRPRRLGFGRLDDEQLVMSMFSCDAAHLVSAESAPTSDDNSVGANGNEKGEDFKEPSAVVGTSPERIVKNESEETVMMKASTVPENDQIMDPRRIKRILANRQSAQRSRIRKVQYISELERSVSSLQTQVSVLSPRVAFLDHQRSALTVGNSSLRQRIVALAHDKIFKDAHQEALKKEIERLRQVYQQQNNPNSAAADGTAANCSQEKRGLQQS